jgi:hypothetical protein
LAIVDICSIASLDTLGDGAASVVVAVLVDGGGADILVAEVGEFMMAAVLVDDRGTELLVVVLTGCMDGASCSAVRLASHVEVALAVDLVGAGSLGVGSSVALGTGLLAVWSSVRLSVKAALAIAGVVGAISLVVVFTGWVDTVDRASWSVTLSASHVEAASVDMVGVRSLGVGSMAVLDGGLLAVWFSVVFSAASAIRKARIALLKALFWGGVFSTLRLSRDTDLTILFLAWS